MSNLEIKRYPGKLIYRYHGEMVYYLDQLEWFDGISYPDNPDDLTWEDNWIAANFIDRYLKKWYGISSKLYWNLIYKGDINYIHICECSTCNNSTEFLTLWKGYRPTCSYECRNKLQSEYMIDFYNTADKLTVEKLKEVQHQWWWTEKYIEFIDLAGISRNILIRSKVVSTWNFKRFLQFGSEFDTCYFYITKTSSKFKFGVSQCEYNEGWNKDYLKYKIIVEDTRLKVASLEYLIKLDLNLDTEFIEWELVYKFIESFGRNYKLLFDSSSTTIEMIKINLSTE